MLKLNGVFAVVLALSVVTSVSAERRILVHASFASVKEKQRHPKPKRIRPIEPDFRALEAPSLRRNERRKLERKLTATLFDDTVLHVDLENVERNAIDAWIWTGKIDGHDNSSAVFVVKDRAMVATIWTGTQKYMIEPVENGGHEVFELDLAAFPDEAEPLSSHPSNRVAEALTGMIAAADSGETIDILVVYTDDVRAGLGTTAAAQAAASNAIAATNEAYENSGVNPRVRLVGTAEVVYAESGQLLPALNDLTNSGDGHMDGVHALRDELGADAVALLVAGGDGCGIAWLMTSYYVDNPGTSFAHLAFSVTTQSCAVGNLSFPHELGHNFGLAHDRFVAPSTPLPSYPYAYGYVDTQLQFRDIMAYVNACGSCPRIQYFSTPNRFYLGRPLGVSYESSPSTSADNVRALNNNASLIANWRQTRCRSLSAVANPAAGGSVNVSTAQNCSGGYTSETAVAISASASSGYQFSGWTATNCTLANAAAAATTCTMTGAGNASVSAQFIATCTSFTIDPSSWSPTSVAGSRTVTITGSPAGCQGGAWNASGNGSWLTVSPTSGSGSGSTVVSWDQNPFTSSRSASATIAGNTFAVTQGGAPVGPRADFDGDLRSELLFRNSSNQLAMWDFTGRTVLKGQNFATISSSFNWRIEGFGDFNGDGRYDLLYRAVGATLVGMWLLDSPAIVSQTVVGSLPSVAWEFEAFGDFNGDGRTDALARNPATGEVAMWEFDGTTVVDNSVVYTVSDPNWQIQGTGDFNADGDDEVIWRNTATEQMAMWEFNGRTLINGAIFGTAPGTAWAVRAIGDFDADGRDDILWQDTSTLDVNVWDMNYRTIVANVFVVRVNSSFWRVDAIGDYDGDGGDDVIWFNTSTREVAMWELSSSHALLGSGIVATVAGDYHIQPPFNPTR